MKFWLLTTEYPPQSGGGISTYCWHTAKMFAENGVQVTVFIPSQQSEHRKIVIQEANIRLVYFRCDGNPQNRFLGWEAALSYEFANVLRTFQDEEGSPDFVESQEYGGIAYYALQRRLLEDDFLKGSTFFVTAHAPGFLYLDYNQAPLYQFPDYWIGEMERSVLRSADFVLFPSAYLLGELTNRLDLSDVTTAVLKNPFIPFDTVPDYDAGGLVFFGKLTPQKGGLEMLTYLKEMWDEGFKSPISIVGSGEHFFYPKMMDMGEYVRGRFKNYIADGLIRFEGHIAPETIAGRLAHARVIIVPSTVDNLPYTVLEGMSLGKVLLVSQEGGHVELITHGKNGFTFSHHQPGSFRRSLEEALALTQRQISEIGESAKRTIVEQCGYKQIFEQKINLLRTLKPGREGSTFPFTRPRQQAVRSTSKDSDTKGLLSIVIPFYNLGAFLEDCVKSVVAGTYPTKEVIVINDGSDDPKSLEKLKAVQEKYPVTVVNQKNHGLCYTRNYGAQIARGQYLAFLDADDVVAPNYYTRAIGVMNRYENVSFVGCWAQYFGENDEVWPAFNPEPPYLLAHNMVNSSAIVYRRKDFILAGGNDEQMIYGMEDYETVINLVKQGFHGVVIPEILWNYRIRTGSMAQSFNRFSELYLYRLISRKHADFIAEYAEDVVNLLNANGPGMAFKNPTLKVTHLPGIISFNGRFISLIKRNKILRKLAKKILRLILSR